MINTGLPDPGIGRNPPRYRRMPPPKVLGAVVVGFLIAGGIFYFFNVDQIHAPLTTGQSSQSEPHTIPTNPPPVAR